MRNTPTVRTVRTVRRCLAPAAEARPDSMLLIVAARDYCRQQNLSTATLKQFDVAIASMEHEMHITPTLADLTDGVLEFWCRRLLSLGYSPSTVRGRIGHVHTLWRWLFDKGDVRKLPSLLPCFPRQRRPAQGVQHGMA